MKVLKFGGTSVGSSEMLRKVLAVVEEVQARDDVIVVVSAFGGVTNMLDTLANQALEGNSSLHGIDDILSRHHAVIDELIQERELAEAIRNRVQQLCSDLAEICRGAYLVKEMTPRTRARILSLGELLSYGIIAAIFQAHGIDTVGVDSRELIMTKGDLLTGSLLREQSYQNIRKLAGRSRVVVVPGFIARDELGRTSTLGRGGSDFTAALLADALEADALEIWTDVSGVMTANPRLVATAHPLASISYEEAMELSFFGAKVIYPPTLQPLVKSGIQVWIKNTNRPKDPGTLITATEGESEMVVKGISSIPDIALITVSGPGLIGVPGTAHRMFGAFAGQDLSVLFITQSSSEHTITAGVLRKDAPAAREGLREVFELELQRGAIDKIAVEEGLALMAAVGDGMREYPGVAGKLFSLLGENGVNIRAIAQGSTERNISFVINEADASKALNVIHDGFFLSPTMVAHVFNVGVGNVGREMLAQLVEQQPALLKEKRLELRIAGLANSRKMLVDASGLNLTDWPDQLEQGDQFDIARFVDRIIGLNLRNSVFVDNTGAEVVAEQYERLLKHSISVAASNKIAASDKLARYRELKALAIAHGVHFRYETNVAAGLPVLGTINDMLLTGDRIHKIEAVLSGSLNFIFNGISEEVSFSQAVAQAREMGFTEPDPAIDLSGLDVARKILILARESGRSMEMEDVNKGTIFPRDLQLGMPWEELISVIEAQDLEIEEARSSVVEQGKLWRFMATLNGDDAQVGVEQIDNTHPAWVLQGKDNLVLVYSDRYPDQPLVIKGAGAGPEVTASGVLADILRIAHG